MNTSYDEIKKLLKASKAMLESTSAAEGLVEIRRAHGILSEQDSTQVINPLAGSNVGVAPETEIDKKEDPEDKQQSYRVSGGIITLHGKEAPELKLTVDEKTAFQETMDDFAEEVSDLVDFDRLNIYRTNVEWGGKIIDFDIDFYFTIGETNGIYINGNMIKIDPEFLEMINKLQGYYEKFKIRWSKVMADRKKTPQIPSEQ